MARPSLNSAGFNSSGYNSGGFDSAGYQLGRNQLGQAFEGMLRTLRAPGDAPSARECLCTRACGRCCGSEAAASLMTQMCELSGPAGGGLIAAFLNV